MMWTWLSIMNPHRYAFGFAYGAPLAAAAAGCTLLGLLVTKDKESPFRGPPVYWLVAFMVWITASWLMGLDPEGDYDQWVKVMKIFFMVVVALMLLRTKQHVIALAWVAAGSLALLGAKGGAFTVATGGNYRVWGPPGSFIHDNNEFALSLVMTIPLLRFLQIQLRAAWQRHLLTVLMLLCAAAALGTQSRGGFLAIMAMSLVLWWRGNNRALGGILILTVGFALVAFMPDTWSDRMNTISEYEQDGSAMGRISAWWTAFGIGKDYLFGVGFDAARPELFAKYSPLPDYIHAAHSIYFQVLGNHGFVGLFLFCAIFVSTFLQAGKLRKECRAVPHAKWCHDLGGMVQVSLVGYAAGGAFLSLAYFDLPYNIMILVVVSRVWVRRRGWETDPQPERGWFAIPGAGALHPTNSDTTGALVQRTAGRE